MNKRLLGVAVAIFVAALVSAAEFPVVDQGIKPGDDFYLYVNNNWMKANEIPPDRSSYSDAAFLVEQNEKRTLEIIEGARKGAPGSDARRIADYYDAFMDEAAIERLGLKPLEPMLREIAAVQTRDDLSRLLGTQLRADVDMLNATDTTTDNVFGLWVAQDFDTPTKYATYLIQGGLGMPDRDYYLSTSQSMVGIRAKYLPHLAKVLTLANIPDAGAKAAGIVDLETRMARVHASRVDTGDVAKGNNHWSRADFNAKAPGINWQAFFAAAALDKQGEFVVWQPGAITGLSALVASQPLAVWKDYLTVRAIERYSTYLPKAFVTERFEFYSKTLSGTPQLRDRWKRGIAVTNIAVGDAVGKLYAERYFPPAEKARAEAMVRALIAAFSLRIDRLDWMAPETKVKAKAKLAVLKVGVGYPDTWIDHSGLEIRRDDALGNAQRASLFTTKWNLSKLGRTVDRSEWVMTPQTVNAVSLPAMNSMNFPAGMLQPPYFDPSRPEVMDYGAMGSVIGHEISHNFDDMGALFDSTGRLRNWWTPEDFAHFKAASTKLVKQYDQYRPFPDLALDGQLVLGENIADLGGLAVAYDGWKISLEGKPAPVVNGFNGEQQFFISHAQSGRGKSREPALRQQIITDGHAPDEYRVAIVRNLDAWYAAFDVKPGEKLYLAPTDRVRIW